WSSDVCSSDLTLRGRDIVVKAQSTYDSLVLPVAVKTARAIVDIHSSTLQATNDVEVSASVSVDAQTPTLLPFATVDATAEAAVSVRGNASIAADSSATLAANSNVKAHAVADLPNIVALPADAGVAVVRVDSKATVDVLGAATLATGGALALGATNTLDVQAKADATAG